MKRTADEPSTSTGKQSKSTLTTVQQVINNLVDSDSVQVKQDSESSSDEIKAFLGLRIYMEYSCIKPSNQDYWTNEGSLLCLLPDFEMFYDSRQILCLLLGGLAHKGGILMLDERPNMATAGDNGVATVSRKRLHLSTKSSVDTLADNEVAGIMHAASSRKKLPIKSNCRPAPFSYEQEAEDTRSLIDYTVPISMEDAKSGRAPRAVRIYADGIYDMFHTGHARQLMQAKMAFPNTYLIVGICSDALTFKNKGRTVMNDTERYEAVRHCRYVDEVVTDAPWTLDMDFLEKHKIDFVAHDELPYATTSADDVYKFVKDRGMFLVTERTEGISTTDVITRIIKDYDLYIRRNLARGYSHKELNVSYMKAKRLRFKDNYEKFENKLKDKGKDLMDKWKGQLDKGNMMLHKWEEKSKELIGNFVEMFGKEGKFSQWIQENTIRLGRAISPSSSPLRESPPSPSTSDPGSSPPAKRGRYTPPLFSMDNSDSDDDDDSDSSN